MNQTLEEAPETGRVKNSHHPTPQRPLLYPLGDPLSCAVTG
jgi:hypothetical protein